MYQLITGSDGVTRADTSPKAMARMSRMERTTLRLSIQVHRRGYFMPIWNLRAIVERRLVGRLFRTWRKERSGRR